MLTMLGWFSAASARASRANRSRSSLRIERGVQQLEGDEAIGVGVAGQVQVAHAAAPDEALDLVAADSWRRSWGT